MTMQREAEFRNSELSSNQRQNEGSLRLVHAGTGRQFRGCCGGRLTVPWARQIYIGETEYWWAASSYSQYTTPGSGSLSPSSCRAPLKRQKGDHTCPPRPPPSPL